LPKEKGKGWGEGKKNKKTTTATTKKTRFFHTYQKTAS
jgi:hypothetical protein